jgi:GMP synthase-like glutamine amidotransferase
MSVRILVLEHDPSDPLLRLGPWLAEVDVDVDVRRLHAGDELPADLSGHRGVISLGGEMGALDDDVAPWLPGTRALLRSAVDLAVPTLGICLGSQLLGAATGGTVRRGPDGPEIGAYLTAKRDAADDDPLFRELPMTPDVLHYHYDVVDPLPPGAVLLISSHGYPNQAWRIGSAAWGLQFHIEPDAETIRDWARTENLELVGRLGPVLDDAAEVMADVWRDFTHRFVRFITDRDRVAAPGRRLPLVSGDQ